jgi:hypothetical protein
MSNPSTPRPRWAVDSQTPRTRANATGTVEDGYDIAFHTADGHNGLVFVPKSKYTPAAVSAVIDQAAADVDTIGSLTSDTEV